MGVEMPGAVQPERDHIRGAAERPRDAGRVRRLPVPLLRRRLPGRRASCSRASAMACASCSGTCRCRSASARGPGGRSAAEAAGAQGRFWDMHDRLFEHRAS